MQQQAITQILETSKPVDKQMDLLIIKEFKQLPKNTLISKQLQEQISSAKSNLKKALMEMNRDQDIGLTVKQNFKMIYQYIEAIDKQINNQSYEKTIPFGNIAKLDSYQKLKQIINEIQNQQIPNPAVNLYLCNFYNSFSKFNTKMHDVDNEYIQKKLTTITNTLFKQYKQSIQGQKERLSQEQLQEMNNKDFDKLLFDQLRQSMLFKLHTFLSKGKPDRILELTQMDNARQYLTQGLQEYQNKVQSEERMLKDEVGQLLNLLQLNGLDIDKKELDGMNFTEEQIKDFVNQYNEISKKENQEDSEKVEVIMDMSNNKMNMIMNEQVKQERNDQ